MGFDDHYDFLLSNIRSRREDNGGTTRMPHVSKSSQILCEIPFKLMPRSAKHHRSKTRAGQAPQAGILHQGVGV